MQVSELMARLREVPGDWRVYATRAGSSLEVWNPDGPEYGYVFTDERPSRWLTKRAPTMVANLDYVSEHRLDQPTEGGAK